MDTMTKFESMWDDQLGHPSVAKHCIKLKSNRTQSINGTLHRARSRVREFDKMEMDKMLKMVVFKQAKRNWPFP